MQPYTHTHSDDRVDDDCKSAVLTYIGSDLLQLVVCTVVVAFAPILLVAVVPLMVIRVTRTVVLVRFLAANKGRAIHCMRMYTTSDLSHTHLRRSAMLSQHPLLHSWYMQSIVLVTPPHMYALLVWFVLTIVGGITLTMSGLSALALVVSRVQASRSLRDFYVSCVEVPVETELPHKKFRCEYAASRATELVERADYDMGVYFASRATEPLPASASVAFSRVNSRRGAQRSKRAGTAVRASSRERGRGKRKDRKQQHHE